MTSRSLSDLSLPDLADWMEDKGFKRSHAPRVLRDWLGAYAQPPRSWRPPSELLGELASAFPDDAARCVRRQVAEDGATKLLWQLRDGQMVESVLMPDFHPERAAGCLSSQVGCAMGCDFCATAQMGFTRNLTAGEILEQFRQLRKEATGAGRALRTIVFMGMGEPLLNFENLITAVRRIADPQLGAFGGRQITVSSVGIVPGIDALRRAGVGVHLAISLHAPDDETRGKLLPMGKRFAVREVLAAADRYQAASGRVTTIQYCLLEGVNDAPAQARRVAHLLAGRRMHVNLLRYNPTGFSLRGREYAPSSMERTEAFLGELRAHRVVAHLRRARGSEIDAACGQLRNKETAQSASDFP